jgi:hypothetical protein
MFRISPRLLSAASPLLRPRAALPLLAAAALALSVSTQASGAPSLEWPALQPETKPWTRWWWPGSAVDPASLTAQLEEFSKAGLGGVEITPIYGARGFEDRSIPFLSPHWMEVLEHTGREAQRLGLKVDMATGTGWPFGGPWVTPEDGSQKLVLRDGHAATEPTKMKVKRAAPGGEGLVIDPYSTRALHDYLEPFSAAFSHFPRELVRAQFHDSFEYYEANFTTRLPEVFRAMHGYELDPFVPALLGQQTIDLETLRRIKSDYRETLARLHLDYIEAWVRWSHERGFLVRNQSHGAPANLLDLYGAVDIAETEVFGSTPFPIPGLRRAPDEVRAGLDLPEPLVIRMASSAAHVTGHPLISSETCTWLREHWKVTLSDAKPEIDRLFLNGINHIFYHGTIFSPNDAPWPGWFFYASTQFNPNNTWWQDFPALNNYVARVQSFLQGGRVDNDVLLYWPFADALDDAEGLMKQFAVHDVRWLTDSSMGHIATELMRNGFAYDYISDAQLLKTKAGDGALHTQSNNYRVLVVPAVRRMPVETLKHLLELSAQGAKIIFASLPEDVPGQGRLEERRAEFKALIASGRIQTLPAGESISSALKTDCIRREPAAETGLGLIRRATADGHTYFFANLTGETLKGWIQLGTAARSAAWFDALSGQSGYTALRTPGAAPQVFVQLAPGESRLLQTSSEPASDAVPTTATRRAWVDYEPAPNATPLPLRGPWSVTFLRGGPVLPQPVTMTELRSWTDLDDPELKRFGGTARYRLKFELPAAPASASGKPAEWLLDLGDVRESARVRLNGQELATAWSLPFRIRIGSALKPGRNVLELDVTNLAANRIRDLDRRKVDWKIMHEINIVNISYKPFDASNWDIMPSGLRGPVVLIPLQPLSAR